MAADNVLKKLVDVVFFEDLKDSYLIDVRPKISYDLRTIEGAINIPATELRERFSEVPTDKKVVLFCDKGFNSYIASRILKQKGFENISSLSGGFLLYKEIIKDKQGIISSNFKKTETVSPQKCIRIDACGMQCPGPILKLADVIKEMKDGETVEISTTDAGFGLDIDGWCSTTGHTLLDLVNENKITKAIIQKGSANKQIKGSRDGMTQVVFSNDLDKALAAFIIANGAIASGKQVTMFFTFWGLSLLKKCPNIKTEKCFIEKMFGWMLPNCAKKLALSKMHMGGMGTWMMTQVMKSKNVLSLPELIQSAQKGGARFIACNMSMDVMGIKAEELIDGVEIGGVAKYIEESSNSGSNLFI